MMEKNNSSAQSILERLVMAAGASSEAALAADIGVKSQAIYDAKKRAKIPDAWVRIIAERFGISADWLFFGRGCMRIQDALPVEAVSGSRNSGTFVPQLGPMMLREEPAPYAGKVHTGWDDRPVYRERESKTSRNKLPLADTTALFEDHELIQGELVPSRKLPTFEIHKACEVDIIMIPMMEARLSAGCGSLEVSEESHRNYAFRSDFIHRKGNPADMVLMRVSGDSMEPEICDNDVVLIDQSKKEITPGRLYAVGFEDAIYLKRIDRLPGKVILRSTNVAYPPVQMDIQGDCSELFRVIGRVLWCGREYK